VRYFCPKCWSDFGEDLRLCPRCGLNIAEFWKNKDYVEQLIFALGHPEPATPIRAAWILGKLGDERAVEPLIDLVDKTQDVYIARAAVKALGRLGTQRARQFLRNIASTHPAAMVRNSAAALVAGGSERSKEREI